MSAGRKPSQVLLIQVRENATVAQHEQACFLERLGLPERGLRAHNLYEAPQITWSDVADADVVLIGGSAVHSATETHAYTEPMAAVVRQLADAGKPTFGSCWGHQFIARALGGEVITDVATEEVGCFEVYITPAGAADPLLQGLPPKFAAHMGHHDRVAALPPGTVELAYSQRCRNQIFRIAGKPMYGAQFHAEMSAERLIERLGQYRASYLPSDEEFERLRRNPLSTPDADRILHRFWAQVPR